MINTIRFNNNDLTSVYGVSYDGSQLFDTPDKDVTFFPIPGKNGDLSISNDRFNNIEISINCFIRTNFKENYSNLINFLASQEGYGRLETSTEDDIYREAAFVKGIQPDTGAFLKYGQFTLVFNCKPQKWLKSGEAWDYVGAGASMTLTNPSNFYAKPLISTTGTGTITIGTSSIQLTANTSTTFIDCEIQDAYEGTINRNGDIVVTNGFPVIGTGDTRVSATGATFGIQPRWWKL